MIQEITYTIAAKRIHITKTHREGLKHRTTMAIFDIFQYFARQPFFYKYFYLHESNVICKFACK